MDLATVLTASGVGVSVDGEEGEGDHEESDASDAEDDVIKPSDAVLLVAHTEEEYSCVEVQVYDEENGSLYVHHDIALPAFPHGMSVLLNQACSYTFVWNNFDFPAGTLPVTTVRADEQHYDQPAGVRPDSFDRAASQNDRTTCGAGGATPEAAHANVDRSDPGPRSAGRSFRRLNPHPQPLHACPIPKLQR